MIVMEYIYFFPMDNVRFFSCLEYDPNLFQLYLNQVATCHGGKKALGKMFS